MTEFKDGAIDGSVTTFTVILIGAVIGYMVCRFSRLVKILQSDVMSPSSDEEIILCSNCNYDKFFRVNCEWHCFKCFSTVVSDKI